MRNRVTVSEAAIIGARLRDARLHENMSVTEVGASANVHPSQVTRCEHGGFKTVSPNVQTLCKLLNVKHDKVPEAWIGEEGLRARFDALLAEVPASAAVFERLFDVLEAAQFRRPKGRKARAMRTRGV
jgi:transcriptional regulator with XRE-family HTH domain